MELNLPPKLLKALEQEAKDAHLNLHAHIVRKLEGITPPIEFIDLPLIKKNFSLLLDFLAKIPGVKIISSQVTQDAYWWVKLDIDIYHPLAWQVVQELGFVLNYISIEEKLPTVFMPVSPPPYMNGGPEEFLSWVIESRYNYIDPKWIASELEGRLPNPVDDLNKWASE